jgi:hypothetical protein
MSTASSPNLPAPAAQLSERHDETSGLIQECPPNQGPAPKMMPAPKTVNLETYYGGWDGFCQAVHQSIGRKIGSGVLTYSESWPPPAKKAEC